MNSAWEWNPWRAPRRVRPLPKDGPTETPWIGRAIRRTTVLGSVFILLGAAGVVYASQRAGAADRQAETHTHQVHAATRVFVDWLAPSAVDRQLDAMALRRMRLLEQARWERLRAVAGLAALGGVMLLLVAYGAQVARRDLLVPETGTLGLLPDAALREVRAAERRMPARRHAGTPVPPRPRTASSDSV